MKRYDFIAIPAMLAALAACSGGKKVEAINAPLDNTVELRSSDSLPPNATAVCFDRTYSTVTDGSACLGHGGTIKEFKRYRSN
ncbi:hypothetical protein [Glaesserella sp.]|uniref:hypothetical protein n=1 Tax=Glaesserella sp. TaxID=2094731 RepID=UPI0035A13082